MKVLLPTDFSENSYNAIRYALALLEGNPCTFFLLNTYTPVLYDNEYLIYNGTSPGLTAFYKDNSVRGLERIRHRIQKDFPDHQHSFETLSSFNMLTDEIREQVASRNIDLVVMGTKGATGAEEILFGTHTVHAIKKAKCPLLAIPANYQYSAPRDILFPTDYQPQGSWNLDILKEILSRQTANLHILHVFIAPQLTEEQERNKAELIHLFRDHGHFFYGISRKSVPQAVYDFQEENPVNMLVMVNNKHSFFENLLFRPVINEIGFHVKTPFLVIPSKKRERM